jgi:Tol biopolymer transport system component
MKNSYLFAVFSCTALAASLFLTVSAQSEVTTIKLNGPLVEGGNVDDYLFSPDSQRVVYVADQGKDEVWELYSAPMDGSSAAVKLNADLTENGDIYNAPWAAVKISPDSQRVIYIADQDSDEVWELYSVPIDGSSGPVKLNGALTTGGDVVASFRDLLISPDSQRVIYLADQETDESEELYSVPIDGSSAPVKLNTTLAGESVIAFTVSPDSSRVVYNAEQDTQFICELYSMPLQGGVPPTKLNHPLEQFDCIGSDFVITSDSSRVIYTDFDGLYITALDGSAEPFRFSSIDGYFDITPDNQKVVVTERDFNIYVVPLDGSSEPVLLDSQAAPLGVISADSSRVAYKPYFPEEPVYSVALDGNSAPIQLSPSARQWKASPDRTWAVFDDLQWELYTVPLDGSSEPVSLGVSLTKDDIGNNNTWWMYVVSPDGQQIVHISQEIEGGPRGLYTVRFGGNESATKLTPTYDGDENVIEIQISPDSRHAIYQADQDTDEVFELYATALPQFEVLDMVDYFMSIVRKSVAFENLSKPQGKSLIATLDTALTSQDSNTSCRLFQGLKRQVSGLINNTSLTRRTGIDLVNTVNTIVNFIELDCQG